MRMGVFTALAIAIHIFRGIATFLSALANPTLAVGVTVAIALQYTREYRYISRFTTPPGIGKSLRVFLLSGLSEPIRAAFGF